jgi:MoxR-like ATPase
MNNSSSVDRLNKVSGFIKNSFVGKDDIVDLLMISLVARENTFLLGPPGTAKSAIVRLLSACIQEGKNFEYLLTRFTEPNEIFGPFDIRKLKEGELLTNTEGMLPEASMVFLDEIFNANSAILNSLLMALNERIFRRGKETRKLPALMFVGASNQLPEDETLQALLDRFLLRVKCDYVDTDQLEQVLVSGWQLQKETTGIPQILPQEIQELQALARQVELTSVRKAYVHLIHAFRNAGIRFSDRRAVKVQNLLAASAVLCGRNEANVSDFWVLRYVWDSEDQIELLAAMVNKTLDENPSEKSHPQAQKSRVPNAEEIAKELNDLLERWNSGNLGLDEQNVVKDKLRYLQSRSHWIQNPEHKNHLQQQMEQLWQKMLQTV